MSTLYITQNQFIVCVLLFSFPLTIYLITSIWFQLHFFLERRGEGGGTCRYLRENCVKNIVSDVTDDEPELTIECQVIEPLFIKDHFS